ncbi:aspartate/glutamate racemase family protein [Anaerolentibacter hominis]|uniref:aspartate/glutamate racemase family protein n=1 Tax=Anaerolentibacter hominis TaxID=3079009 RepID=UPI0031B854DD
MGKIAILHTTPATIAPLNTMIKNRCPDIQIYNFIDDSILPMLKEDIATLDYAFEKLLCYAQFAQRQGVQLILSACSSVGDFADYASGKLSVPLIRIDDAVSDTAVKMGKKVAVLATLPTTLNPSSNLIRRKGNGEAEVTPVLVEGAYEALQAGDKAEHDRLIAEAAGKAAKEQDVVYLAQASMADAAAMLPEEMQKKVLFSTGPAVDQVVNMYRELNHQ